MGLYFFGNLDKGFGRRGQSFGSCPMVGLFVFLGFFLVCCVFGSPAPVGAVVDPPQTGGHRSPVRGKKRWPVPFSAHVASSIDTVVTFEGPNMSLSWAFWGEKRGKPPGSFGWNGEDSMFLELLGTKQVGFHGRHLYLNQRVNKYRHHVAAPKVSFLHFVDIIPRDVCSKCSIGLLPKFKIFNENKHTLPGLHWNCAKKTHFIQKDQLCLAEIFIKKNTNKKANREERKQTKKKNREQTNKQNKQEQQKNSASSSRCAQPPKMHFKLITPLGTIRQIKPLGYWKGGKCNIPGFA